MAGHRLICGDSTSKDDVDALLAGVRPHLMVTDPPYGRSYDPAWRKRAGVNLNPRKLGKVVNDDQDDWREAWTLFPGSVAYVVSIRRRPRAGHFRLRRLDQRSGWRSANSMAAGRRAFG